MLVEEGLWWKPDLRKSRHWLRLGRACREQARGQRFDSGYDDDGAPSRRLASRCENARHQSHVI